ncbi:hypothetical protein O9993_06210 [Vibrio lentus]|nr:hypothetical protein [Vibrio lentus]
MRRAVGVYGGEGGGAHHYFRDFGYCDSGMIPWLLVIELSARLNNPLHQLTGSVWIDFPLQER